MSAPFGDVHPLDADPDAGRPSLLHGPAPDSREWLAVVDGIAADTLALAVAGDLRGAVGQAFEVCLLQGVATDRLILRWTEAVLIHLGLDVFAGPVPVDRLELRLLDDAHGIGTLTPAERWALQLFRARAGDEHDAVEQLLDRGRAGASAHIVYGERLLAVLLAAAATLRHVPGGSA